MTVPRVITGRTRLVGVWGHPVGHSRSPVMHNTALAALGLDWAYVPFEVRPADVGAAIAGVRALNLVGVNVTVPLKEIVPPFLDSVSEDARRIGSVNTVLNRDGLLHGESTDGPGFLRALADLAGGDAPGQRALLLGAGGSARAVAFALAGQGWQVAIANRTRARSQELADRLAVFYPCQAAVVEWGGNAGEFDLIVNTTSLGMHPHEDAMPALPPGALAPGRLVLDLVYAPPETRLLREARRAGCRAANGLGMLVYQGALSLALWAGLPAESIPVGVMAEAVGGTVQGQKPVE